MLSSSITWTHQSADIGHGLPASFVACTHQSVYVGQWKTHHPRSVNISLRHLCIGWAISLWPTLGNISNDLCTSGKWFWPTTGSIIRGLHLSVVACVHRQGDIVIGQQYEALAKACVLWERDIGCGLTTSFVACSYFPPIVRFGLPASPLPCKQ